MRFLYEMNTGKSWQGIRQEGGRVRQREIFGERGRATQRWEKTAWVDFDRWSKSTTPVNLNDTWEFLEGVNHLEQWRDFCQSRFVVAFNILWLIWPYSICSNNTRSTTHVKWTKLMPTFVKTLNDIWQESSKDFLTQPFVLGQISYHFVSFINEIFCRQEYRNYLIVYKKFIELFNP